MKKEEKKEWPQRIAVSERGMIATQHYEATKAGIEILAEGGNAIDAAVASAFALGVCEPNASGLGGQTMMMIHLAKTRRTFAVDGSSHAPSRATREDYNIKENLLRGYRATTVPSTPAVLSYVLERYGTMPISRIIEPAIRLAEDGYLITELQSSLQKRKGKHFKSGNAAAFFLRDGEKPYSPKSRFRQPVLAQTLRFIGERGVEEFYLGEIARLIYLDMNKNDGFIQMDDLAQIPYPIEREPIDCRFGPFHVRTFPPPGSGRTLVEMINIISQYDPKKYQIDSLEWTLLLIETIRRAQLDRRDRPFDPNFYPQVQDRIMLSTNYAKLVSKQIRNSLKTQEQNGETTHVSVMDMDGNVVSLTQSIERIYGSFIVTPDLGFLYNNYMSAFEYNEITHPYYLRPNGIPWASVAPTIIFRGRKAVLAIGSPGSERITSSILQVLIRLANNQSPQDAVAAPRVHCSADGNVSIESSRIRSDIPDFLRRKGFSVKEREPFSFYMGCVQLVLRQGKEFIGVADLRRDGSAGGPDTTPERMVSTKPEDEEKD